MSPPKLTPHLFPKALLDWYATNARDLPWRHYDKLGPYEIWLAEVMLQQTTVATVIPYYQRFLTTFPTIQKLAAAPIDDVLHLWQGLGYYRRAHLLHKTAKAVVANYDGQFPTTEAELLKLPGFGPYTSAAVAAMAFNQPASVCDGNVERVMARLYRVDVPLPKSKKQLQEYALAVSSRHEPRHYANAIMELGATVCTPKNPRCDVCPVNRFCHAYAAGDVARYPVKSASHKIPKLMATATITTDNNGRVYLVQRPVTSKMLGGLWETPTTCSTQPNPLGYPMPSDDTPKGIPHGKITHTFSHFHLTIHIYGTSVPAHGLTAFAPEALPPLSTLTRKILRKAGVIST